MNVRDLVCWLVGLSLGACLSAGYVAIKLRPRQGENEELRQEVVALRARVEALQDQAESLDRKVLDMDLKARGLSTWACRELSKNSASNVRYDVQPKAESEQ